MVKSGVTECNDFFVTMTFWTPQLDGYPGPRYRAIAAAIADAVTDGTLPPGAKLPPHRHLADALGVTVGTVTRGYGEAERRGLVTGRVGSGTYVLGESAPRSGLTDFSIPAADADAGTIDFGLAFPVPAHREAMLADALRRLADDPLALRDTLSYQPEPGLHRHRETLATWLREDWSVALNTEELLLTVGGLHALHLSLQVLTRPGDAVAAAGLTYPGMLAAARQQQLELLPLATDDQGIVPASLAELCRQRSVRAVYCMPNQDNPTTACMGEARRQDLLGVAMHHGVTIIEDDVHLVAAGERPPNLVDMAPDHVVYITSCSKILAGGLRLGLLRAPRRLCPALADALRGHCWMAPPLNAELACRWIESGLAGELASWQRQELGARQALAAEVFADLQFRARPYGFNLWLELPEPWRAQELTEACARRGVQVKTGEPFAVGRHPAPEAVRLALSAPVSRDAVRQGLEIVRDTLAGQPATPVTL